MRRLLFVVLFLLLGFYVVWPAVTAWRINGALKLRDAEALERRIDFPSVRESMRPAVAAKVAEMIETYQRQAGPAGALIAETLKGEVSGRLVNASLATLVTPDNLIRLASEAGPMKERVERIIREQLGRIPGIQGADGAGGAGGATGGGGGLVGGILGRIPGLPGAGGGGGNPPAVEPARKPAAEPMPPGRTFGISNVKRFAFTGPLGFEVGVAKEPSSREADLVAEMGFRGGDWRMIGLRPRL
jgi:hypothetical protein